MRNLSSSKYVTGLFLSAALVATPAIAALSVGEQLGTTEEDIRAALEAKGYVVLEIEKEGNEIEVELKMNGEEFEIEVDPRSGAIVEIEGEEDDD